MKGLARSPALWPATAGLGTASPAWRLGRGRPGSRAGPGRGAGRSGQDPGAVVAGQPVPEQGAQVDRGAPGVQPGAVLGGAGVAQFYPAAVVGGGPGDDP